MNNQLRMLILYQQVWHVRHAACGSLLSLPKKQNIGSDIVCFQQHKISLMLGQYWCELTFTNMHLVLVREGYTPIHVPDVTLSEGHTLSVGGVEADTTDIEPAQWFKTLIMDYMTIDCSKRIVKWSMEQSESSLEESVSEQLKRNSRVLFSEGEFYDFEARSDELFDSIAEVFDRHGQSTLAEISPLLLRALHCHILPNVNLNQDDIPKLEEAMIKQQLLINKLEERVEELTKVISLHDNCLLKHRNKMVDDLYKNPGDVVNFDQEILEILKGHVSRDCQRIGLELDQLQNAVVRAKQKVENSPGNEQLQWDMRQKRASRDAFYEDKYLKVINVRETLSERISLCKRVTTLPPSSGKYKRRHLDIWSKKPKSLSKATANQKIRLLHNLYAKTSQIQADAKDQIKNLVTRKVLMVSVKEAIAMTIRDLQSEEQTVGLATEHGYSCTYPTDVLNRTTIPSDWLTFEDRVTSMVTDESHVVGAMHSAFCQLVATTCRDAYQEDAYYRTLDRSSPEEHWELQVPAGTTRWFCNSVTNGGEDYLYICDMDAPPTRKATDRLKSLITKHFEEICPIIREHLEASSINKTWIAYETNLYGALNEYLIPLYQSAYSDCTETLKTQANDLTVDDLEISEDWILDMLVKRRDSGIGSEKELEQTKPKVLRTYADEMMSDFEKLHVAYVPKTDVCYASHPESESYDEGCHVVMDESSGGSTNCPTGESEGGPVPQGHLISDSDGETASDGTSELSGDDIAPGDHLQSCISDGSTQHVNSRDTLDGDPLGVTGPLSVAPHDNGDDIKIPCDECRHQFYGAEGKPVNSSDDPTDHYNIGSYSSGDKLLVSREDKNGIETVREECTDQFLSPVPEMDESVKSREYNVQSEKFKHVFDTAYQCLISLGDENTPLKKMQMLTRCLRAITTTLAKPETSGCQSAPCADELVTILVVLLLNLTPDQISHLYIELKFVIDLMAPFLESGVHSYSVVQLEVAYQYLFTKLMKIKNRKI